MFVIFTEHIDKHGECKFILVGESGKYRILIYNAM